MTRYVFAKSDARAGGMRAPTVADLLGHGVMKRLDNIDAYATGELADSEADAFEEAMFDAPDDVGVSVVDAIMRHGPRLVEHGTWDIGVTPDVIQKLVDAGRVVQVTDVGEPGTGWITIRRDAEFVATVLPVGVSYATKLVDVDLTIVKYDMTKTIKDVRVHTDGKLYGLCERALAELAFGQDTVVRVRENHGPRTTLAEWQLVGNVA